MSAHPLDVRLAHLEGAYEQISDRLNGFDLRFARLEEKVDRGFETVHERMDRNFQTLNERLSLSFDVLNQRLDRDSLEARRLIVTGAASMALFLLTALILPFIVHGR